ncbi:MAG: DUF3501 family protein [Sneathiella sp.]
MTAKRDITRADILDLADYEKIRKENKQKLIGIKKDRRIAIGPFATLYFENYDTMWAQIHEMLFIERGGEEQIEDELSAYNPLIPNGNELVATFMIEIDDPVRRDYTLRQLGYIEDMIYLSVDGEKSQAVPEQDVERTTEDGKTSAIHFLHFPLTETQKKAMLTEGADVFIGIDHEQYGHMARLSDANRVSLAGDL